MVDRTAEEIARLAPAAADAARIIVNASREAGWPVVIRSLGGFRSPTQQDRLYAQGRTAPGPIVTYTRSSAHESGLAFDLDLLDYPRSVGMPLWKFLGAWWKSQGLRWGGDWGDYGHFELR